MSIKSGFHNSINGDRKYNAEDMNRPYKDIVSNGVFPNPSDQLQVFASSGMIVSVSAGGGLFGNGWAYNDAPELLTLDPAEATLSRIDAIVLRRDESEAVRDSVLIVKKGTPSQNPVRPEMVRDDYVNEYCLATILITPGTTIITGSMITDTRPDTTVCGWVTGLIDQVDTTTLFNQWQSAYQEQYEKFMGEFAVWWEDVQNLLADDESASAEILRLREEVAHKADKVRIVHSIPESNWASAVDSDKYDAIEFVDGILADDIILVGPATDSIEAYSKAGVMCVGQADGMLIFTANEPVAVNVNIVNMGE